MGNPVYRSYPTTTNGAQPPINLDWLNFSHTLVAVFTASTLSYTIEGTLDDVVPAAEGGQAGAAATPRWFPILASGTGNRFVGFEDPWLFVRINFAVASDGATELKLQQSGVTRGF